METAGLPARGELLHGPGVAVRIAKVDERAPGLHVHLTDLHAAPGELRPGFPDVGDDELQVPQRPWRHLVDKPDADADRACRAGRGELDEPQPLPHRDVDIEMEPRLPGVEGNRPVDVRDRHPHELELEVQRISSSCRVRSPSTAGSPTERMYSSTICRATSSEYCTGGDFMK